MPEPATLLMSEFVTHDVRRFLIDKPDALAWEPGQGIEVRIDDDRWHDQARPFTPTSQPEDLVLELTLKRYPEHDGVTVALHGLEPGARLLLGQGFGTITYQGPGTFIAAGAGVTPFLAILRRLAAENALDGHRLLLTNKSERDVICGKELAHYLGERCILTFTEEPGQGRERRRIDERFLDSHIGDRDQRFYVCGPPGFVDAVKGHLSSLGVHPDRLVYEQ